MRIIIDAQSIIEPLAGIGRYAKCLLEEFARAPGGNEFHLFYGASLRRWKAELPDFNSPDFHPRLLRFPGRVYRALTEKYKIAPPLVFMGGFDVFHGLNYYVPGVRYPSIVNIYDISFLLYPQFFTGERLRDIVPKAEVSAARADKIITGSESAKSDILNAYKIPEEKVRVILNGVEDKFRRSSEKEAESYGKARGLPGRFILYVGTIEPRKNVYALAKAYKKLNPADVSLVIAGAEGWLCGDILRKIRALGMDDRIILTGRVPEDELPLLYSSALVFVYPSLYEGFGFPPLEAMACGTPVIAGNRSSLPEIVGDAGICVDPENVDGLAAAIEYLIRDESKRRLFSENGAVRARKFSWEKCAKETLGLYRSVSGA